MALSRSSYQRLAAVVLIVLLGLAAAGRGMGDIPLESHEIYVAQTAENMLESGDWLVPRLNGEYRLTKPPLSYWLVAGAGAVTGQAQVSPALARAPSVLALVGIALLAAWMGARLFEPRIGLLAGLMCVASFSAFKYGHNARPDMLYAFWTTAVLAVWLALREVSPRQARYGAWAMWLLFALGTLTKGPQAPAIMLGGAVVYDGLFGAGWRLVWRRLHAVAGLAIVAVIVLPWYLWLRAAIGATTLDDSQVSGALLSVDITRLFAPFYFLRTPLLWLPWALLLPVAGLQIWRDRRGPSGLLAFGVLFAMAAFTLGPQYREIYMLPWLAPAMVVFAAALVRVPAARVCVALVLIVVAAGLAWLLYQSGLAGLASVLAALVALVAAGHALSQRHTARSAGWVAIAFAIGLFQGGAVPKLWSSQRYEELAFTQRLAGVVDADTPVVVWDIDAAHYSYYLDRPARGFEALDSVCDWIGTQRGRLVLVYPQERRAELAQRLVLDSVLGPRDSEFQASWVAAGHGCRAPTASGA